MASRTFFLPGIFILLCAFILSLLVAISLPDLPALDVVRCHYPNGVSPHGSAADTDSIKEIRFGVWAYCTYNSQTGHRACSDRGHGYSVELSSGSNEITIGRGATRGLAVHPVAAGVTFIALLFSLSSHVTMALFASLLSFIAALLTLIAFAIDIALYVIVHKRVQRLEDRVSTVAAPGIWITLASLILLLMATCVGWCGRRRSRMAGATDYLPPDKSGFLARFSRSRV